MTRALPVVVAVLLASAVTDARSVDESIEQLILDPAIRAPDGAPQSEAARKAKALGPGWLNPFASRRAIRKELSTILELTSDKRPQLVSLSYNRSLSNRERRQRFVEIVGEIKRCPQCDAREAIDALHCRMDGTELVYLGEDAQEETDEPESLLEKARSKKKSKFPGFTFLREEEFSAGGETHKVEVYQHDKLYAALELPPGTSAPECEFSLLPAGEFKMGTHHEDPLVDGSETPIHDVSVQSFLIARTEVTQRLWVAFMGTTVDEQCQKCAGDFDWDCTINGLGPTNPMYYVSWEEAAEFCEKAGLRLPSEAEWEYACRAGTTTYFNVGDKITTDQANFRGHKPTDLSPTGVFRRKSTPVDTFAPNAFGLHDMHGNVWEWVQDTAYATYHGAPRDGSARVSRQMDMRVYRGGSFHTNAWYARSARRSGKPLGMGLGNVGFRPAFR